MFDNATVLVIGAGPTGLLLASELLRRNVECRVIVIPLDNADVEG